MNFEAIKLQPLSKIKMDEMKNQLNNLAKPVDSLGRLEDLAIHLAGIYQTLNFNVSPRTCLVFAADNGVVNEGVSATPQKVTAIQAVNMVNGHTAVAALAQAYACDIQVFDIGINSNLLLEGVKNCKIRNSTRDMLLEPAMTYEEAYKSLEIGYKSGKQAFNNGYQLICVGELGMGNTTAASAIIAALLHKPAENIVGRGSNISDQKLQHKISVVNESLKRAHLENCKNPIEVLRQVGAFELGAMAGAIIAAAVAQKPVLIDGFLSYSATLLAESIVPGITEYVIPTHISRERGSKLVLTELQLKPYIDLQMCVGEGSGAMMLLPWIDGIKSVLDNMNTLEEMNFNFIP